MKLNFKRSCRRFCSWVNITHSKYHTKDWRKRQRWYKNGKKNECEIYQKDLVKKITNNDINLCDKRFNITDYSFVSLKYPNKNIDGYEYTEDIDIYQKIGDKEFYYNLKMVCNKGGQQTRTLREVYQYIMCQLEYLLKIDDPNIYFINILDGDEAYKNRTKFYFLKKKEKYKDIKKQIFIGSMYQFRKWFNKNQNENQNQK